MCLMKKYITLDKAVGETPLSCAEDYRAKHKELEGVAMAYAGRLDPMASGKLLILLGEECKNQTNYHGLDKEYEFSVLLGIGSDTHDVLGRLETPTLSEQPAASPAVVGLGLAERSGAEEDVAGCSGETIINKITNELIGSIELHYPHFSAKTIQGKPLHMWTLENRLHEIKIPTKKSHVYSLKHTNTETISRADLVEQALLKVNSIPPVTEARKALGNDFRRVDVRADWENIRNDESLPQSYTILHFKCIASSGTYMRTLATVIADKLGTYGLAWHIHRTKIGSYEADSDSWTIEY